MPRPSEARRLPQIHAETSSLPKTRITPWLFQTADIIASGIYGCPPGTVAGWLLASSRLVEPSVSLEWHASASTRLPVRCRGPIRRRNPEIWVNDVLKLPRRWLSVRSTHVTYVIGSVQLNLEPIRIVELERPFRIALRDLQIAFLQLRARLVCVEARNAEVVVIDRSRLTFALLNAKEGLADTHDMDRLPLLLQRHSKD